MHGTAEASNSAVLAAAQARGGTRRRARAGARAVAWILTVAGLAAYNWWLLVPLRPGLMSSPDELFSNLEVSGRPYAAAMQHADLAAGLLIAAAVVVAWLGSVRSAAGAGSAGAGFAGAGSAAAGGAPAKWPVRLRLLAARHREWLAMLVFGLAGAAGGLFPETCADGISASCRDLEYQFRLPAGQYIHDAAGIVEFGAITLALLFAVLRTRGSRTRTALVYRVLACAAIPGYLLLGAAYLTDRLGGVAEAVFFTGFTVMVVTWLAERIRALAADPS